MSSLSLIITTRNREGYLLACLGSVLCQNLPESQQFDSKETIHSLFEIIIVDNNSTDDTKQRVEDLAMHAKWKIRYVLEKKTGYPVIYNRGLKEAKTDWVAFLDDDCIAEPGWLIAATTAITRYTEAAALVGQSGTRRPDSFWSVVQLSSDGIWKYLGRSGLNITNFETLDNKNIIYNKRLLKRHGIMFDERLTPWWHGSSEDCDLGRQIGLHRLIAWYVPAMKVKHADPTSMYSYLWKLIHTSIAHTAFIVKWSPQKSVKKKWSRNYLKKTKSYRYLIFKLEKICKFNAYYNKLYRISLITLWAAWLTHAILQKLLIWLIQKIYVHKYKESICKSLFSSE